MKEDILKEIFAGGTLSYEGFIEAMDERGIGAADLFEGDVIGRAEYDEALAEIHRQKEAEIKELMLDAALEKEIIRNGGRSVRAIKALIDRAGLELGEGGAITGMNIDELKREYGYLFSGEKGIRGTGFARGAAKNADSDALRFERAVMRGKRL